MEFCDRVISVPLEKLEPTASIAPTIAPAIPTLDCSQSYETTAKFSGDRSSDSSSGWQPWKVFGSTFATILLAELGDKTQVSTLLMTAESHAPWVVFTGAATALISTSLLGVLVGCWLSRRISPKTLNTSAGVTLAMLSVWLLWDVWQG
jgi:putative Ca2+/H+ antiporter (TMEM165/GDT1 family)